MKAIVKMANAPIAGVKAQQSENSVVGFPISVSRTHMFAVTPVKIENKKTAFWTCVTAGVGVLFTATLVWYKQKCRNKGVKEKSKAETENDISKMAAKTACTIMERAMNVEPELRRMKMAMETLMENMEEMKMNPSFNQCVTDNANYQTTWQSMNYSDMVGMERVYEASIAPGLFGMGLVNYFVAGASIGKTMALTQIALATAYGKHIQFLPSQEGNALKLSVLYYRMEEYEGEFQNKYGRGDILQNSGIQWRTKSMMESFTLYGLLHDIKQFVIQKAKDDTLIFIDPITKLPDFNAEKFIIGTEEIKEIAKSKGITITYIVSAHVDEIKDWTPLTSFNIKGGDKLIQQAGSVIALRRERSSKNSRFLQVLKAPKGWAEPEKVLVCEIVEEIIDENNKDTYLKYVCEKTEGEAIPLRVKAQESATDPVGECRSAKDIRLKKARELLNSGLTKVATAEKLNISRPTLDKWLEELEGESDGEEE